MTRFVPGILGLVILAVCATTAAAQTCAGTASFATGPVRIGAALDFAKDAKQYGGQIAFGQAAGPFAGLSIGRIDPDDTDESATLYAGEIGYSLNMAGRGTLEVCPVLGYGYASLDVNEGGITADVSTRLLSAGLLIGGAVSSTPTLSVVPSIGLSYVNQKVKIDSDFLAFDESEDFGLLTLAAGFVFNQKVTFRPNIAIPVGLDDSDPTYGVGIAINFGTPTGSR